MRDLTRVIEERFSVRTYVKRPMPQELVREFEKYVQTLNQTVGPNGTQPKIYFTTAHMHGKPVASYGVIRNAAEFFVGVCRKKREAIIDFGYNFEKLILFAASKGLGTCWMAGTFKRRDFVETIPMEEGDYIPAISPVGYSHEKTTMIDRSFRYFSRSTKRKSWETMFFDRNLNPLSFNDYHHEMKLPLEMVRLAPSGQNKQPWVIVICEEEQCAHFYSKGSFTHLMDMGIAMCHFELTVKDKGYAGDWHENANHVKTKYEYIKTFHWQI